MADFNFYLNRQGIQGKKGEKGDQGFSPVISEGQNTSDTYTLNITNEFETFETPNLRGQFSIEDRGGKYVMYNAEDNTLSASDPTSATAETEGVVSRAIEEDFLNIQETAAKFVNPYSLVNSMPAILYSPDDSVIIRQNPETGRTELTVDSSGTSGDIAQERAERIAADADLQNKITSEENARIAADGVLGRNISNVASDLETEKQIRLAADTQQQQLIDAERQERETQDASLQSQLSTKLTADNIKAGENITITKDGNNITINSEGGGVVPENIMTLDTDQDVTGEKVFKSSTLKIGNDTENATLAELDSNIHYTNLEHSSYFRTASVLKGNVIAEHNLYQPHPIAKPDGTIEIIYAKVLSGNDVDNQTIKIVDGQLHADFSEIGDEVNSLANRMNTAESAIEVLENDMTTVTGDVEELQEKVRDIELAKFPNATIIGAPTINNGQISNFSMSNYLQFPFEFETKGRTWLLNGSFDTRSDVTIQQNIIDSLASVALAVRNGRLVLALSTNGTSFDLGEHESMSDIDPNTKYYCRLSFSGTQYLLSLSTDKEVWLPEIIVSSTQPIASTVMTISSAGHPFGGIINLNDWDLTVGNVLVWQGMDDVGIASRMDVNASNATDSAKEVMLNTNGLTSGLSASNDKKLYNEIIERAKTGFGLSNFTIVGNPSITEDGTASGCSLNDYITANIDLSQADSWEVKNSLIYNKPSVTASSGEYIKAFKVGVERALTINCTVNANNRQCRVVFTGGFTKTASFTKLNDGDKIDITATFDGSKYIVVIDNTTQNETLTMTIDSSDKVIGDTVEIARSAFVSYANNNIVDLKHFSVIADGVEIFNGYKKGVDIIGSIEIPYTQSKTGAKIVDASNASAVQQVYEQTGEALYYIKNDSNETVTLPKVDLYAAITRLNDAVGNIDAVLNEILGDSGTIANLVNDINGFSTSALAATPMMLSLEPTELDLEDSFNNSIERATFDCDLDITPLDVESYDDDTDIDFGGSI